MDASPPGAPPTAACGNGVIDQQTMTDGQRLYRRSWPRRNAENAVLIVHGLGEHSGRYAHVAAWFGARGYDVRSYDQRGHGLSPGPRATLRQADDLLTDLTAVYVNYARDFARPPLLLGHSMGGLVVARAVLDGRLRPSAVVLSSPALRSWENAFMRRLVAMLAVVLPNLRLSNGLPSDNLSHDPSVALAYTTDPLRHNRITPRLAQFILEAGARSIRDADQLDHPTLLLVAGADKLVDPSGSRDFSTTAGNRLLVTRYFDTLYHELMNEAEPARSLVMKQLGLWLDQLPVP